MDTLTLNITANRTCSITAVGIDREDADIIKVSTATAGMFPSFSQTITGPKLRKMLTDLARVTAERDELRRELKVAQEASAIFEQNSAACSEEFEARLKAEKQRDRAVELLRRQDKAYGKCQDASDWYIEHYPLVEEIETFLASLKEKPC